uniref:Transmembrane and coiled-coil domains protein 1 n=1 Tax=Steinernema glaseri TaxID=37863 RepID=A0A1I8ASX7_9BILA
MDRYPFYLMPESNERGGSIRSSDDAGGSGSGVTEDSPGPEYRAKLQKKIDEYRNRISRLSIKQQGELDSYIRVADSLRSPGGGDFDSEPESTRENPQMCRVKQHFNKQNKKYSQEIDQLQKKLIAVQSKLEEYDKGFVTNEARGHRVLANVGQGLRTGANVITAPGRVLGNMLGLKKSVTGSADNIPAVVASEDVSVIGQSTFYGNNEPNPSADRARSFTTADADHVAPEEAPHQSSPPVDHPVVRPSSEHPGLAPVRTELEVAQASEIASLKTSVAELKSQNSLILEQLTFLRQMHEKDVKMLRKMIDTDNAERERLETTLSEALELHQNENENIRERLQNMSTCIEYRLKERFNDIGDEIEIAKNKVQTIEERMINASERSHSGVIWRDVALSALNVVVELLKIALYIVAVVTDGFRSLFSSPARSTFSVFLLVATFFLVNRFGFPSLVSVFRSSSPLAAFSQEPTVSSASPNPEL